MKLNIQRNIIINKQKNDLIMITASVTEFGLDINKYLDKIEIENETLFIERNNGSGSIVISSQEYNSILETMHLLSSKKNAEHLYKSKEQLEKGVYAIRELIEV